MNFGFRWRGFFGDRTDCGEEARHFVLAIARGHMPVEAVTTKIKIQEINLLEQFEQTLTNLDGQPSSDLFVSVWDCVPPLFPGTQEPGAFFTVGRGMFETDRIPDSWIPKCFQMDEIWVPNEFNWHSFRNSGIPEGKLFKLPPTTDLDLYTPMGPKAELPGGTKFKFLASSEWLIRKGWDLLLEAYWEEFSSEEPVVLLIKTWSRSEKNYKQQIEEKARTLGADKRAQVILLDSSFPFEEMPMIYRGADCFVLPSHGEATGLSYMQAMGCGLPAIGTGWGGNLEFMNKENSYLLNHELVSVPEGAYEDDPLLTSGHRWANPDKDHLKATMRRVFKNQAEAQSVGQRGRAYLEAHCSYDKIADILKAKLTSLLEY